MNFVTVTEKSRYHKFINSLQDPKTVLNVMPNEMADAIYSDTRDFVRIPVEILNQHKHECERRLFRSSEIKVNI